MALVIEGPLARHAAAEPLAREVMRVHRRYATEIVAAFRLCPFVRVGEGAIESAFGQFCVVLDRELDVALATRFASDAAGSVMHVVYPLVTAAPTGFERFAASLGDALRRTLAAPPVLAAFHPELSGDPTSPDRLVGMLRRAPDPFVQFVPEGLHEGGTTFAGAMEPLPDIPRDVARDNFARLAGGELAALLARIDDIHADRARTYAPYLKALSTA